MGHRALCHLSCALPLAISGFIGLTINSPVFAQLTPDNTLGAESSTVTVEQLRDLIQGGAIRGNALFHSFDEFNVESDRGAFFDLQNNTDILNIFTRVTGGNVSNVLGTLGVLQDALNSDVLGNANLFLLNPNGITFGANANLQLNGSFFATTADSFDFDNFVFSASGEEAPPPLLTVSIPRFASFRDNPGTITNQSIVENDRGRIIGLQVQPDQNIGFIGGEVKFTDGGRAGAPDGRIEIGAVGGNSFVSFTQTQTSAGITNYVLGYEGVETFQDIILENQSADPDALPANLTAGGDEGGGSIQLQGRNITLDNGRVRSNATSPSRTPGNILINSSLLTIENGSTVEAQILFTPETGESANGASIEISTEELLIQSGGRIQSFANLGASGDGGDITINAGEFVEILGGEEGNGFIFAQTIDESSGNAGNITINTPQLLIQDGGGITASTTREASGSGGSITVNATEFVRIIGEANANDNNPSTLASQSIRGSTGNGGNIIINTPQLLLQDGGSIGANARAEGDGGNITINASEFVQIIGKAQNVAADNLLSNFDVSGSNIISSVIFQETTGNGGEITINSPQLLIQNGGFIDASTEGVGNGGSIKLNVSGTILVEGTDSGIFSRTIESSLGNAGSIDIDPQQVTVQNNGTISVESLGTGEAGILTITSDNLTLNNGTITATTDSADGGNITLNIADLLLLRNGNGDALISATAGGQGQGGNLTIDTTFLVAFPNENSDITANASQGRGGNINITATGIYGIQFQNALTDLSDITATSDNVNLAGTVTLNTPENQINQEQIEQPEEVVDSSDVVSQSVCSDFGGENQLANSGRSGLPQIPGLIPRNSVVNVDLVDEVLPAPPPQAIKPHHRTTVTFLDSEGEEFKPAMGAVLLPNGMVEFVDYNPAEVYRDMYAAAGCNRLSEN